MDADTYIFAGGGSGGHLFPGVALAEELLRRCPDSRVLFVGSERPIEKTILQPTGFTHHPLPVEPPRRLPQSPIHWLRRNWCAWRMALRLLAMEEPRWVIGLGGYISAPTVWAARRRKIPVLLMEQNAIPGAATRWLAGCARQVCLSFEESRRWFRQGTPTTVTGNPIRESIRRVAEERRQNAEREPKTLLILGGSQGAESLNEGVVRLLPELRPALAGWRIVHQAGAGRSALLRERYRHLSLAAVVEDFFPDLAAWYAQADLAISRAGATTLAELSCMGCPAILIPYPFAADRHQAANAEVFVRCGGALSVSQGASAEATALRLKGPLLSLLTDERRRDAMSQAARRLARPDAAERIVELLRDCPESRNGINALR
jgi:UDP-N-acetylglucosamine--N-acetylmuramyl-(pentapeptide) pyrophosphoryl-undecaprenol N-acetylglucosamine transferase